MNYEELIGLFDSLSPEAQRRAIRFMQRLQEMQVIQSRPRENKCKELRDEPFIGMWSDREDMADSSGWVRAIRKNEWMKPVE
ncbi:MAG TPA: DUF2281 domain-containing protein [Blastocatellia bacterium]|nr:DUF2281 domain-containing protein [Blastocatellia bacterium]